MENTVKQTSQHKSPEYEQSFSKPIIRTGRWTLLAAVPLSFLPAIYLYMKYGAIPPLGNILTGWFLVASIYGSYYFIEPISFFPVLGVSGTYMSFLAGNIGNMRLPCAAVAQEALKVEGGSHKAELVATLGIAGSIITNLIVVTIAAVAGNQLFSYFPQVVVDAFSFVLPGIFGSMFAMFALKHPRYGAFALSLVLIMLGIIKVLPVYVVIPVSVFSTIAFAVAGYRMRQKQTQ